MKPLRWSRILAAILGTALAAAVAAACLPDNEYQRFGLLEHTIQNRIRWIYERMHFDPTPIDVAVLGPSRSGAAVSGPRLQADFAALGYPLDAVNFSLPENGRDLHWVILQQLLATKTPRLIVIGVIEKPSRFGHPAYKYVAPVADVVDPAFLGNLDYLSNLIYLPYRQIELFAARLFPGFFDLPATFDPARYIGHNFDSTVSFRTGDGLLVERDKRVSRESLLAGKARYERGVRAPMLGARFADAEFGAERAYVGRMAEAARARGIRVVFLFLPYYEGPSAIQERAFYERYGPILDAGFLSTHDEWYSDVAHLNHAGAVALTDWLAPALAAQLPKEPK